jgi:16S rRNA (uracil1498-N3)-methyltransferase
MQIRHWQKIAQHAAEQSGRTVMPKIEAVEFLAGWAIAQSGLQWRFNVTVHKT